LKEKGGGNCTNAKPTSLEREKRCRLSFKGKEGQGPQDRTVPQCQSQQEHEFLQSRGRREKRAIVVSE